MLSALKRRFYAFAAHTPGFLLSWLLLATLLLLIDFLIRLHARNSVDLTFSQTLAILRFNVHWVLALSIPMALAYGLSISTAVKNLEDPRARQSHLRHWLAFSLIAFILYGLHNNYILPEANHQATLLRRSIIHHGDISRIRTSRSDRELNLAQMADSLRATEAALQRLMAHEDSPRKARQLERLHSWRTSLQWERAKKYQLVLLIPLIVSLSLSVGLLARFLLKPHWRILAAGAYVKGLMTLLVWGMRRIEMTLDANGYSPVIAWVPFTLLATAMLALSYFTLKPPLSAHNPTRAA